MQHLGIDIDEALTTRWRSWLAPEVQPFFLTSDEAREHGFADSDFADRDLPTELADTYALWQIPRSLRPVPLTEERFSALPRTSRAALVRAQVAHDRGLVPAVRAWQHVVPAATLRAQADGHRFVWWPSLLAELDDAAVLQIHAAIETLSPSRHAEVPAEVWDQAHALLPDARLLAGSFPASSGPNCLSTVMSAAGAHPADQPIAPAAFESWLSGTTRPRPATPAADHLPGTVLVWRSENGTAQHAAVTLGAGWAFHKPSMLWSTPRKVLTVAQIMRATRTPGLRLHRYAMTAES